MDFSSLSNVWLASHTIPPKGHLRHLTPTASSGSKSPDKEIVKTQETFLLTTESWKNGCVPYYISLFLRNSLLPSLPWSLTPGPKVCAGWKYRQSSFRISFLLFLTWNLNILVKMPTNTSFLNDCVHACLYMFRQDMHVEAPHVGICLFTYGYTLHVCMHVQAQGWHRESSLIAVTEARSLNLTQSSLIPLVWLLWLVNLRWRHPSFCLSPETTAGSQSHLAFLWVLRKLISSSIYSIFI